MKKQKDYLYNTSVWGDVTVYYIYIEKRLQMRVYILLVCVTKYYIFVLYVLCVSPL